MKLKVISIQLILSGILVYPVSLSASEIIFNENNSIILASQISSELTKKPSGEYTPLYISTMMKLFPATGRNNTLRIFQEALSKMNQENVREKFYGQILKYSVDELDGSAARIERDFTLLKKWKMSGPWKRFGRPDIDFKFNPEAVYKIEEIEKGFNQSPGKNGKISPFKADHPGDETYYATCSFSDNGSGVILWIDSDAVYKLIINGKELVSSRGDSGKVVKAYSLSGAGGYTVQIKMQSGAKGNYPYIMVMVTDGKHKPLNISYSSIIYNYNFNAEKLYSSDEQVEFISAWDSPLKNNIHSDDYLKGYRAGTSLIQKFPYFFPAYRELIPLLDKMNREVEFNEIISKFRNNFPHSEIHYRWLADFYMTRDKEKFLKIIKTAPLSVLSRRAQETYLYLLCGEKMFKEAVDFCYTMESEPYFRNMIPEIIRASGNDSEWRKSLIEKAALYEDPALYYSLGLAEMKRGFDPVMYWEKSFSLDGNPGLMKDLSDVYENSIINDNDIYNGIYTDHHPEFGWNGKKRRIIIHIFESGRVLLEGEDTVPPGRKLRSEKVSEGGTGFSNGEISTGLPYIDGLKILYVLTAKDGLPESINFEAGPVNSGRLAVEYNCTGEEEYSVIKYSAELRREQSDPFKIVSELVLKSAGEKISWLEYEVLQYGGIIPSVRYNGKTLSGGKKGDGGIKISVKERISKSNDKPVVTEIFRFSSDEIFADWYRGILNYTDVSFGESSLKFSDKDSFEDIIRKVHLYTLLNVSENGGIDFNPCAISSTAAAGRGTVEEKTYLAKAILQSRGIKSYIAFRKNKAGLIDKILLYVPENMGSGYWLNFYGDGISDKMEPGMTAIVITGEGYNTIPVNPETYIR